MICFCFFQLHPPNILFLKNLQANCQTMFLWRSGHTHSVEFEKVLKFRVSAFPPLYFDQCECKFFDHPICRSQMHWWTYVVCIWLLSNEEDNYRKWGSLNSVSKKFSIIGTERLAWLTDWHLWHHLIALIIDVVDQSSILLPKTIFKTLIYIRETENRNR